MSARNEEKQKVRVSLTRQIFKKAKILAAKRETSISGLLAQEIESLVAQEDAYESAERQALALLRRGFHMGGRLPAGLNYMSGKVLLQRLDLNT